MDSRQGDADGDIVLAGTCDSECSDAHEISSNEVSPSPASHSTASSSHVTPVGDNGGISSSDVLIIKELNEMKLILQQLLHEKQWSLSEAASVNKGPSGALSHQLVVESALTDSDLTFLACVRQRYPSSASPSDISDGDVAEISEDMMAVKLSTSDDDEEVTKLDESSETMVNFTLGKYELTECCICYESKWLHRRPCCDYAACTDCVTQYFISKVQLGLISIECINIDCNDFVYRDEISLRLPKHLKGVYINLLINFNCDSMKKTCPKCNYLYQLDSHSQLKEMYKQSAKKLDASRVTCVKCDYPWCFICCAPWHEGITCKSYRKGDVALYEWARKTSQGQVNAQKCPKCKILISKSSGCDHMHCLRCKTDFCYRCGEKLRRLKFFGDHYSKLSIFGCKYRYKASKPVQRKLIRGAVFGTKLFIAPIIGSVALFTGIAIIGIGITALPFYGGIQLYRKIHNITLIDSADVNNNRQNVINRTVGQNKGFVSTAAQTIHVSFIDDNYVDEFYPEDTRRVT